MPAKVSIPGSLRILLLVFLVALPFSSAAGAQTVAQLRQDLQLSRNVSQLEADGAPSFHLFATFTLKGDGVPDTQGTLDELWKDPLNYRRILTLPGRTLVEVNDGTHAWTTADSADSDGTLPLGLAQLLDVLTPFAPEALTTSRLSLIKPATVMAPRISRFVNSETHIRTEPDIAGVSPKLDLAQTIYEIDKATHQLKLINRGDFVVLFASPKPVGKQSIAREVLVRHFNDAGVPTPIARLQVSVLEPASDLSALDATPPAGAQQVSPRRGDANAAEELVIGQRLVDPPASRISDVGASGGPDDGCPPDLGLCNRPIVSGFPAARNVGAAITSSRSSSTHMSSSVLLRLHIDTRGKVSAVTVLQSPNDHDAKTAVDAVKKWKYCISYQAGKVVEMDRTVEYPPGPPMNF